MLGLLVAETADFLKNRRKECAKANSSVASVTKRMSHHSRFVDSSYSKRHFHVKFHNLKNGRGGGTKT